MKKRLISLMVAVVMLFSMLCPAAYADDETKSFDACSHDWVTPIRSGYSVSVPGTDYSISVKTEQCSKCKWYKHIATLVFAEFTYYSPLNVNVNGLIPTELTTYWLNVWYNTFGKNATATKFTPGGGSTSGGGVGRPKGYADDKGSALVDKDGWPTATYTMLLDGYDTSAGCDTVNVHSPTNTTNPGSWYRYTNGGFSGSNGNVSVYGTYGDENNNSVIASVSYYFVAPVSGYYIFSSPPIKYTSFAKSSNGFYQYSFNASGIEVHYWFGVGVSNSYWSNSNFVPTASTSSITKNYSSYTIYAKKGQVLFASFSAATVYGVGSSYPYKYISIHTSAPTLTVQDLSPTQIQNNNTITINNNTWNGNIYTDNSTNLTYIYPQYTTVNEKNETVTNISNTPIIYNNETQKYYTYDTVTNNYYYITYEQPATPIPSPSPSPDPTEEPSPSPSPAPTEKPGGSISTPETGKPGGDTGDTTGILAVLVEIRDNMIQGFLDIKSAFVAGFAELSANFTLAIENLNLNITNIFNKKFPDQSTPETAPPSPSPSPSPSPAPLDPILPETQNLIIPKMNSNTFTDEHGTWIATGSSKYSDVFDFFHAFDRSTSDFWETNASPSNLQIEIPDPESYYIDGYIMRISKFNNRYAKEWTLQGSDDGKTWDDLDTQKDQNLSDMEEHKYSLTLRKAYKYYRLNMSNYASSMCSLSHFNLLGYDAKDVVTPTPAPTDPPSPSPAPDPGKPDSGDKTNNFWTIIFPNGGGSEDGKKGIFWALVSLILALIAFFANLAVGVGYLFPFLPDGVVMTINTCLIVIFLFTIIKFIMRSK